MTLVKRVRLGRRVLLRAPLSARTDSALAFDKDHWLKVPLCRSSSVDIGDDAEIRRRQRSTAARSKIPMLEERTIRLDNQIQIAHNVPHQATRPWPAAQRRCRQRSDRRHYLAMGSAGILGRITVADKVTITSMTLVTHSIREQAGYSSVRRSTIIAPGAAMPRASSIWMNSPGACKRWRRT